MPYVVWRDHALQFRRRYPKLVELGAPKFLRLSLRTEFIPEAMKQAAALIAIMQRVEDEVVSQCVVRLLSCWSGKWSATPLRPLRQGTLGAASRRS